MLEITSAADVISCLKVIALFAPKMFILEKCYKLLNCHKFTSVFESQRS